MGINELLSAHDARFIDFDGLLKAIAGAEGVTVFAVARAWQLEPALAGLSPVLKDHYSGDYSRGGEDAVLYELRRATSDWPERVFRTEGAESDYSTGAPGFYRDEVADAMKVAGWTVPACIAEYVAPKAATPTAALPAAPDDRLRAYVPRTWVTLGEASTILVAANGGKVGEWWNALAEAADGGAIQSNTWGADRDEQPLNHADIRAWCAASGIKWPVPLPPDAMPATDAGLRAELESAQQQLQEARARIAELEAQQAAPPPDSEEVAGKTRSVMLRVIGGLAIAGWKIDIHAARLTGLAEIVRDLESAGAAVNEKTLREWLKAATEVIDKPA